MWRNNDAATARSRGSPEFSQIRAQEPRMLAAECACTILRADHAKLRWLLGSIADAASAGHWKEAGLAQRQLRQLIESLQSFDHDSHRPKGVVLLEALRGRSAATDRFLVEMEH